MKRASLSSLVAATMILMAATTQAVASVETPEEQTFRPVSWVGVDPTSKLAQKVFGYKPSFDTLSSQEEDYRARLTAVLNESWEGWRVGELFWHAKVTSQKRWGRFGPEEIYFQVEYPFFTGYDPLVFKAIENNHMEVSGEYSPFNSFMHDDGGYFILLLAMLLGAVAVMLSFFILHSVDSLLERHLSPRGWRRLFVIAMACGIVFFIFWLFSQGGTS